MTLREALKAGYKLGDMKLTPGYISTKAKIFDQEVLTAGGRRNGELYVLIHNPKSTRYCLRQYIYR